jgi:hypothetical protein
MTQLIAAINLTILMHNVTRRPVSKGGWRGWTNTRHNRTALCQTIIGKRAADGLHIDW